MNDRNLLARSLDTPTVLERVLAIVPEIEARADEIEQATRVPMDLLDKLEVAGAFRMCLPVEFGGEALTATESAEVIEAVASADASVAWHLMVTAGTQIITARLPLPAIEAFYANGPDTWAKAAFSPKGIAIPVEGGYRLSGRWPLASGARRFEHVGLGFIVKDENGIRMAPNGMPEFRFGLVPKGDVKVIETWDAVGLRGTRSDDLEVKDVFVPEGSQGFVFGPSTLKAPTLGLSLPSATAPHHLGVVKGLLKGAIADLATDSLTRKPAFNPTVPMKDDPVFKSRFGEIASKVDGLCTLADMCIALLDQADSEGRDVTKYESARIASAEAVVHHEGTSLMDQIMMLSGSAGVYSSNRQQRRWRDLRCVAQHQAANIGCYSLYAQALIDRAIAQAKG